MTTDANGYPHSGFPGERSRRRQQALNESWPYRDQDGPHARGRVTHARPPIDVVVRVEWEHDGVELIQARAERWTTDHVFVTWYEPRLPIHGLWVRAEDVRRRPSGLGTS